jgi:hypothetical protein
MLHLRDIAFSKDIFQHFLFHILVRLYYLIDKDNIVWLIDICLVVAVL